MVGDTGVLHVALLAWYARERRDLAIRRLVDPYAIWIAETMSQQTQIGRVGEALPAFLESFPDVTTLAAASVGSLLRAWGGLGYPRRAMALREAARDIVTHHGGRIPRDVAALTELPGVGPYTARAVAAIAYGVPVTALDVNARRVIGRVLGGTAPGGTAPGGTAPGGTAPGGTAPGGTAPGGTAPGGTAPGGTAPGGTSSRRIQELADSLAPAHQAADWNHALMDLGATVCRPVPECAACPLQPHCAWARGDRPEVSARATAPPRVPFRNTNRYARGHILIHLRAAMPGSWQRIDPTVLSIAPERIDRAMAELEQEGLVERDGTCRSAPRYNAPPAHAGLRAAARLVEPWTRLIPSETKLRGIRHADPAMPPVRLSRTFR